MGSGGPPLRRSPQRPRKRRRNKAVVALSIFLGLVFVLSLAGIIYSWSLFRLIGAPEFTGDPTISEAELIEPDEKVDAPDSTEEIKAAADEIDAIQKIAIPQDKDVSNILIIGTDNRGTETNGRSDSMMVLSLNKRTGKITLVSLMRGLYVKIPGRGYSMLNASYSYGGASLLLQTIEDNLRIHIEDAVSINFSGFVQAIDIVGGIDIKLTATEITQMGKTESSTGALCSITGLSPGVNLLNGEQALTYSRLRKLDSDFVRTSRQRIVIETLFRKLTSQDLARLNTTVRKLLPLVKTNMSANDLLSLALDSVKYRNATIRQLMLPIDGTHRMIVVRGTQMESFDVAKNVEALHEALYGG